MSKIKDHIIRCCPPQDDLYWRENSCGYTNQLAEAGLYTEEKAKNIENGKRGDIAISIIELRESIKEDYRLIRRKLELIKRIDKKISLNALKLDR